MRTLLVLFIGIGITSRIALGQCHLDFVNTFWPAGFDGQCHAAVVFDDGTGSALYVGGSFETIGNRPVNRIARWDGVRWQSLGRGLEMQDGDRASVGALVVHDEDGDGPQPPCLIVGGWFDSAGGVEVQNVARWDGERWSSVGWGIHGHGAINALLSIDFDADGAQAPRLIAAGRFYIGSEDGISFHTGIWDGQNWSGLGNGLDNDVFALAAFDPDGPGSLPPQLFAGGEFRRSGETHTPLIARWQAAAVEWQAVGEGMSNHGAIYALAALDADGDGPLLPRLFAGGDFSIAGPDPIQNLAVWNGTSWSPAGQPDSWISNLYSTVEHGQPALFASGNFNAIGGAATGHVARWDGAAWSFVMPHASGGALIHFDENPDDANPPSIYALASVYVPGVLRADGIARWDGNAWSALAIGTMPRSSINALEVFDADGPGPNPPALYVAGSAYHPDGSWGPSLERWDGAQWSDIPMDPALSHFVFAMTTFDDGTGPALYVAGDFYQYDGPPAASILRWDGSEWSALDGAPHGAIYSLAAHDDGTGPALYVAGQIQGYAEGDPNAPIDLVARWDGQHWSALGFGLSGSFVTALASWDPDESGPLPAQLIATGNFLYSGPRFLSHIAAWDGTNWRRLDNGLPGIGWAAIAHNGGAGNHLYVAGNRTAQDFSTRVARWNGTTWLTIAEPFPSYEVHSFASFDEDGAGPLPAALYVGGARRLDGSGWTYFDGYPGHSSRAMRVFHHDSRPALYLSGSERGMRQLARVGPPGDLDGDLSIGVSDLAVLLTHFGTTLTAAPFEGDLDGDTDVDLRDLTLLLAAFGSGC